MKKILGFVVGVITVIAVTACGSTGVAPEEHQSVADELASAQAALEEAKKEADKKADENAALQKEVESIQQEYAEYKEKMAEYEDLEAAEAEARKIEAESIAAQKEEESRLAAEEESRQAEEKEKVGYDTGITYDQLARTPDDFNGEKVKFYGRVIQVIEDDTETQIRLAVDDNYDTVLLVGYDPSIVSSRVLEDDMITIYGQSVGLISYESTLGGKITIPGVYADKIE